LDFSGEDLSETTVGTTIFGDSTPRLRSVSLCGLTWVPTNRFITVTRLLIGHCFWSHPVSTILNLLSGTPQLVDLILSGMLHEQREEAHVGRARNVHLTSLRRFSLQDIGPANDDIASLFSKLVLPRQAVVLLNNTEYSATNGRWIPEMLFRFDLNFTRPTTMRLRFYRTQRSHRIAGRFRLSVVAASQHGGVMLTKEALTPVDQSYRFASIFHLSQLQDLRYLEAPSPMEAEGPWPSRMWSSILPELLALERLTIFGRSLPDIAKALDSDGPVRMQPRLCPQLSRIVVLLSFGDPRVDNTMAALVAIRGRLHFSHVTIGYLRDYRCERRYWQSEDDLFDSAEYVDYEEVPRMETPWPDQPDLPALPRMYWPKIKS